MRSFSSSPISQFGSDGAVRTTRNWLMAGADTDTHQFLRAWRRHRNKTLENVTEKIGSKVNTISGWETGNRRINLDDLARLAAIYEVSPADLLQSPEIYEQRQALGRLTSVASRLTSDQVAHLIWFSESIASSEPQPTASLPPSKGPEPPRPFRVGGRAARKQAEAECEENVVPLTVSR